MFPCLRETMKFSTSDTGDARSIRDIADLIARTLKVNFTPNWGKVPHRKNEVWFTSANISKAKDYLKWQPQIPLEDGLSSTISWYRNHWKI